MNILIKALPIFLIITSIAFFSAQATVDEDAEKAELIALRIYADWCGHCKTLDANLDKIKTEFSDSAIWFAVFDVTDDQAKRQTSMMASQLGLSQIYEKYNGKTGILLLINPSTGEIVEELNQNNSADEIKTLLRYHS